MATTVSINSSGGGGEDYVDINSAGPLASATGDDGIAVGENTVTAGIGSVGIGPNATATGNDTVAIGNTADAQVDDGVVIGAFAVLDNSFSVSVGNNSAGTECAVVVGDSAAETGGFTVLVGANALADSANQVVIGESACGGLTAANAIAIGKDSMADAASAIQLGAGSNTTASTLQFLTSTLANSDGLQATVKTTAGAPGTTPADGSLVVNSNEDVLYFRSGGAWVTPPGGEDYFAENYDGALPTATGTDSLAIGEGAAATALGAIAIGRSTAALQTAVALGDNADAAFNGVAIGQNATAGQGAITMGFNSDSTLAIDAVVIGTLASATTIADNSVVIGESADSQQSGGVAIGHDATCGSEFGIAIGDLSVCGAGVRAIALGRSASASGARAIAMGDNAIGSAADAVQFGTGTNSTASTLQYLTNRLANAQGLYTSFTSPTNYTPADDDNVTSHLTAIDTALGTALTPLTINRETLAATKSLASGDDIVQALDPNGTARDVILSDPPAANDYFVIINDSDGLSGSGNTLNIKETAAGGIIQTLDDTTGLLSINAIYHSGTSTWVLWS